ncbi:MAG: glycosyltransferase N-terminal domain-containing protein [Pseudomonadota bacterium]
MAVAPGLWAYLTLGHLAAPVSRRSKARRGSVPDTALAPTKWSGEPDTERPTGTVIWIHAAPGSRLPALIQLIERVVAEGVRTALLTTSSVDQVQAPLPEGIIHVQRPVDTPRAVARFLKHWRPDVAVFSGSEIWPACITGCNGAGIPLLMFDAHFPRQNRTRWRWAPWTAQVLLTKFDKILTGSHADAQTLRDLGVSPDRIEVPGFIEEGTAALPCNEGERDALAQALAVRPVWLAARVCFDELPALAAAHRQASRLSHRLLLILVPNMISRAVEFQAFFNDGTFTTGLRSAGDEPEEETQIYIADTEGEMGLWYRLAPITFVGNTLSHPGGGHDPYEPAALGSAVVHGPNIGPHEAVFSRMNAVGAARRVSTAGALGGAVSELLSPDKAAEMAHRAWQISSEGAEVSDRAIELIDAALGDRTPG